MFLIYEGPMVNPLKNYSELNDARTALHESKIAKASNNSKHFFGLQDNKIILAKKTDAVSLKELNHYKQEVEKKIHSTYKGEDLEAALKEADALFKSIEDIQKKIFNKDESRPKEVMEKRSSKPFKQPLSSILEEEEPVEQPQKTPPKKVKTSKQVKFKHDLEIKEIREYITHNPDKALLNKINRAHDIYKLKNASQLKKPEAPIDIRLGDLFYTKVIDILDVVYPRRQGEEEKPLYRYMVDQEIESYIVAQNLDTSNYSIEDWNALSNRVTDQIKREIVQGQERLNQAYLKASDEVTKEHRQASEDYDPFMDIFERVGLAIDQVYDHIRETNQSETIDVIEDAILQSIAVIIEEKYE